jgi:hypothetical protein
VDSLVDDLDVEITSLQEIGYHRTTSEIASENTIGIVTSGARIRYTGMNWHVAGNFVYNYLTNPLVRDNPSLYQLYQFSGRQTINASLDYSFRYKNLHFSGETAVNDRGGVATVNSITADLDPRIAFAALYRYYDPKYFTLNGNAFAEGTDASNESGFYLGMETRLGAGLELSTYFDFFQFPWLKYQVDAPTKGYEMFAKLDYAPNRNITTYIQYRFEQKGKNLSGNTTNIDQIINHDKHNLRFHFDYNMSSQISLRSRVEFSFYQNHEFNKGFVIYQDIVYKPEIIPLKFQFRLAFFDTDNYDTRIYAYESDVLYAFSIIPYYGQGLRYYFNISYDINRYISIWLRFSQTYYTDRDVISSGLGEIEGRTRSEIKVQVRAKF